MSNQLLVRDVPEQIRTWIEEERNNRHMTQKDFVLSVLHQAHENSSIQTQLPFEPQHIEPSLVGRIPFSSLIYFRELAALGYRLKQLAAIVFSRPRLINIPRRLTNPGLAKHRTEILLK